MKRINLAVPERVYQEAHSFADEEGITDTLFIVRAIRLLTFVTKLMQDGGSVYYAEADSEDLTKLHIL